MVRERCERHHVELDLPEEATVATVREALARRLPEVASLLPTCAIAIGHHYRHDEDPVGASGVEIAVVPPVSGG